LLVDGISVGGVLRPHHSTVIGKKKDSEQVRRTITKRQSDSSYLKLFTCTSIKDGNGLRRKNAMMPGTESPAGCRVPQVRTLGPGKGHTLPVCSAEGVCPTAGPPGQPALRVVEGASLGRKLPSIGAQSQLEVRAGNEVKR
jgi:hypothetical protein